MCHQTVGLIARQVEEAGISTLCLTSARDITRAAWPPRGAFLDFPLGHTAGRPNQPDLNRSIMIDALAALETIDEPGRIVELRHRWGDDDDWKDAVMRPAPGGEWEDERTERLADPQYQSDADRAAAESAHEGEGCVVCAGIDY